MIFNKGVDGVRIIFVVLIPEDSILISGKMKSMYSFLKKIKFKWLPNE